MIPENMSAGWRLPRGVNRQTWNRASDPGAIVQDERAAAELGNADTRWVLAHVSPGCRFIDLGCGGGRLLDAVAPSCSAAVGIDISWPGLGRCRDRFSTGAKPWLIRTDLADLDCVSSRQFDVAACLFSTLGMISPRAARESFLRHAARILKSGGLFLVHAHNRWWHLGSAAGRQWLLADAWSAWMGADRQGEFRHPDAPASAPALAHYSRGEMASLLSNCGFEVESIRAAHGPGGKQYLAYGWHAVARAR